MKKMLKTGILHVVLLERHPQGDAMVENCGAFMDDESVRYYVKNRFGDAAQPCCPDRDHLGWILHPEDDLPVRLFVRADAIELHTLVETGALN